MASAHQLLCIVIPCYNEAEVIGLFYQTVKAVLNGLPNLDHQIIFVDDGSNDGSLKLLNHLAQQDPAVRVYALSRNFGHQIALTAGLDAVQGDAAIMMDLDLQHPPALIPEMTDLWRQGNDIVSAIRTHTMDATWLKRAASDGFYRLVNLLSDTQIVSGAADFCLLSRPVYEALRQFPERHRFLRGLVSWLGFQRAFVRYQAPPRAAGHTKYTFRKMLKLAVNATLSFSSTPVRLAVKFGFATIFLSLLYLAYIMICLFTNKDLVPGWTSIIFLTTFLGGVQLAFVGLLGEYIARIFEEVKRRPLYVLKQKPMPASSEAAASAAQPPG
jgi:glycosyltransferase involved in cell wall biosynthesis